jgi:hypothetical protein
VHNIMKKFDDAQRSGRPTKSRPEIYSASSDSSLRIPPLLSIALQENQAFKLHLTLCLAPCVQGKQI